MKLAVLSDIHGNLPALETATDHIEKWSPDMVILNGDIVNRGPLSKECLDFVLQKPWHITKGNHEAFVIGRKTEIITDPFLIEAYKPTQLTYEQLDGNIAPLEAFPTEIRLQIENTSILATHASLRGNRDASDRAIASTAPRCRSTT